MLDDVRAYEGGLTAVQRGEMFRDVHVAGRGRPVAGEVRGPAGAEQEHPAAGRVRTGGRGRSRAASPPFRQDPQQPPHRAVRSVAARRTAVSRVQQPRAISAS